jgi:hypothetical protein
MILVAKGNAPARLIGAGAAQRAADCAEFDANPVSYQKNQSSFAFSGRLYGDGAVRRALERAQHGKCCYCEVIIPKPYALIHVEHYRPKGYSQQSRGSEKNYPGYYWLAYEWDNLFLSCAFCNSRNKRNFFPLKKPSQRALNHHANLSSEEPFILCPSGPKDPRDCIKFHEDVPRGINKVGRITIETMGLDRKDHEPRRKRFEDLQLLRNKIVQWRNDPTVAAQHIVTEARAILEAATRPSAPWSAMAQDYLQANPVP